MNGRTPPPVGGERGTQVVTSKLTTLCLTGILLAVLTGCSESLQVSPESVQEVTDSQLPEETVMPEIEDDVSRDTPMEPPASPPFDGTVYLTTDAITPESPSDLDGLVFVSSSSRETFDRRVDNWVNTPSWVYQAIYRCGRSSVDIVVNQEFSQVEADREAARFAYILGQMPVASRENVQELWIHRGLEPAGGGNQAVLIHTDYADTEWPYIEEVFIHEAAHTSLDPDFQGSVNPAQWGEAQAKDPTFISTYAQDYPATEDVAESYGAYFVWALHRDQGLFPNQAALIGAAIPARIAYFESLGPEFGPLAQGECS